MMNDQKRHVAHGMTHERTAVLNMLRTDPRLHRAVAFELTRCIISPATDVQARDICDLIADNIAGGEHWKDTSSGTQSRTDDTRARAAV